MASVPHLGVSRNFSLSFAEACHCFNDQDKNICYQYIRWCFGGYLCLISVQIIYTKNYVA